VTVLFCDLVGFTRRVEQLDPEEVRGLLRPYHERARAELERHGGTVEKFIGDAVMALFGAPIAHEDDPERAVRAALAIREFALEEDLELRVGITTGEALISLDVNPAEGEGMASGDVVNTAARLQSAAPVNGVIVDETTQRATRHTIGYRETEPVEAKGKAEPIAVWEASAARSRFGVDVAHHARTVLVGRERELDTLRDAFDRARHERIPQLLTLVGVPGIGKSRLVYELQRIADADPELVTWRQGRCLAYGDGVAFWALGEVVKAQAGIDERDAMEAAAEKLHSAVTAVIVDKSDARWVESHLRPLAGLEADTGLGGDRRGEAFAAWRRYLEALAEQRPLVLVLEDLHWADDGLLDFVDGLVEWLDDVPLLVVCSARPELLERRPGWGGGKLNAVTLGLAPLSSAETAVLISEVLERTVLPAEIQQALLARAEGNPLYAEQYAELYVERGSAEDLPLPETLQGIVAARLDGLSSEEKAVLQDASVVGKVFWTGALGRDEEKAGPPLQSLARKGFLTRQRRSSVESEGEWAFSHMLLRDVAYGQIPRAERVHKHRATAEWIESLGRPEDHAELLAFHWRSALELARASGQDATELETPARLAFRAAGERAFSVNAYWAAAGYYDEALDLWPEDAPDRSECLFQRARALFVLGDERRERSLEEARDALIAAEELGPAAEAEAFLAQTAWYRGQRDAADHHMAHAKELVAEAEPSVAKARVLAFSARMQSLAGRDEEAIQVAQQALTMAEALGLEEELRGHALTTIGTAKSGLGLGAGREELEQGLDILRAANSPALVSTLNNLAVWSIFNGDLRPAADLWAEGLAFAERMGLQEDVRWLRAQLINRNYAFGEWDKFVQAADQFIAECESSPHYLEGAIRERRAAVRLARSDVEGAIADSTVTLAHGREAKDPQRIVPSLVASARIYALLGRDEEARGLADEAFEITRSNTSMADYLGLLSSIAGGLGIRDELRDVVALAPTGPWKDAATAGANGDLVRAAELYGQMGLVAIEAEMRLSAAEELIGNVRLVEGAVELEKALGFYRSVGATFFIERGEKLLVKSA
jgi:class 3 adenylate cyclase/tetratricopeptide (TPR) repeat protein